MVATASCGADSADVDMRGPRRCSGRSGHQFRVGQLGPSLRGQDFDLFVMAPDANRWGMPRSAARRSTSGGPNKAERITIANPKVTGVYAVIVIRESGEGNLLLTHT